MAINERLIHTAAEAAGGGTGNQEEGLILHYDAADVDSFDGDNDTTWYDITNHEFTPAVDPAENFNTVTYTGNETSQSITGVGFQPDLIWVKNRDTTNNHLLFDSIRGNNFLIPNDTFAEDTSSSNTMSSFDSDGFSISGGGGSLNNSSDNYVAWCFKAGGAPSGSEKVSIDGTSYATMTAAGLTDGTEPISKLSVNTKLGFSIVKYTAPALTGDTVAHGLGETPEMIILKSTSVARNWNVFHKDVGTSKNMHFNTNDAANTGEYWTANSNTFSIQDYSASADWIAYAFTSKRGVSKVGSYTGTGAAGNKVYTGFQPAFVMLKLYSTTSGSGHWVIFDNTRGAEPPMLRANTNDSEFSGDRIDFNADGFTLKDADAGRNYSGFKYIYLAFAAEKPDSLIDDTDLELHLDADDLTSSSTTWSDKTSNGNDGTITGADFDAELGNWLDFERSNSDNVSISDSSSLDISSNITLEAWINEESVANYGRLFWKSGAYALYRGTNGWTFLLGSTSLVHDSGIPSTGTWYHIAATYDGSNQKLYFNGELVDTESMTGSIPTNSNTLYIGGDTTDRYFDGKVGQVRIYSSALTADQVMQNYRFTKNAYPNGKHATLTSATWASEGSFSFQNSQYATIPVGGFVGGNDQIKTITAWVKPDTTTSRVFPYTISSSSNSNNYFTFGVYNDYSKVYCSCRSGGSTNQWQDHFTITPDTAWHHMAVTFDGTTRRFYWDGDLQTTTEDNRGSATSSSWITYGNVGSNPKAYIGRGRHVSSWYSDGKVSDVKFFDIALTDDEIEADFNKGQFGEN